MRQIACSLFHIFQHLGRAKRRQNFHMIDMGGTVDTSLVMLWSQAWSLGVCGIDFIVKYFTILPANRSVAAACKDDHERIRAAKKVLTKITCSLVQGPRPQEKLECISLALITPTLYRAFPAQNSDAASNVNTSLANLTSSPLSQVPLDFLFSCRKQSIIEK